MSCNCEPEKTNFSEVKHESRCFVMLLRPSFQSVEATIGNVAKQVITTANNASLSTQGQEQDLVTLTARQSVLENDVAGQQETVPLLQATVRDQEADMAQTINRDTGCSLFEDKGDQENNILSKIESSSEWSTSSCGNESHIASRPDLTELEDKVEKVGYKTDMLAMVVGEMRDNVQHQLEGIQDVVLENPLKKDMQALEEIMKASDKKLLESNKETNKVTSNLVMKLSTDLEKMSQSGDAQVCDLLTKVEKKIDTLAGNILQKVDLVEAKITEKVHQLQTQVETLQDCVLTQGGAAHNRHSSLKAPECPYCMEELRPPASIFQCLSGHLICERCKNNPTIRDCPTCHQAFSGRNRGLEHYLATVLQQ